MAGLSQEKDASRFRDECATLIGMDTALSVRALAYTQSKKYRPTTRASEEVMCSVCDLFEVTKEATPEFYFRIKDVVTEVDLPRSTVLFMRHAKTMCSVIFGQMADYIDRRDVNPDTPCNIMGGLVSETTVADVLSATQQSLALYHKQCEPLRKAVRQIEAAGGKASERLHRRRQSLSVPHHHGARRISSVYALTPNADGSLLSTPVTTPKGSSAGVQSSFATALSQGAVADEDGAKRAGKKRHSNRVVRVEDAPGGGTASSSPRPGGGGSGARGHMDPLLGIDAPNLATVGSSDTSQLNTGEASPSAHQYQKSLREFKLGDSCHSVSDAGTSDSGGERTDDRGSNEAGQDAVSRRMSRRRRTTCAAAGGGTPDTKEANAQAPDNLEARLASLKTLQYFDIICQTLSVLLSVVYDEQIRMLSDEGPECGALRLAEWCVCRIVGELYEDGIDPSCPLDLQLLFSIQGLVYEDDGFHHRRDTTPDFDILEAVWGEDVPGDVLDKRIGTKESCRNRWYEWGVLTKAAFITSYGALYSCARFNPAEYGFRLGPYHVIEALDLREVQKEDVSKRLPSFVAVRKGEHLLSQAGLDMMVPNLTLSVPPEGSSHRGSNKAKPHIKLNNPQLARELEQKYKVKRKLMKEKKRQDNARREAEQAERRQQEAEAAQALEEVVEEERYYEDDNSSSDSDQDLDDVYNLVEEEASRTFTCPDDAPDQQQQQVPRQQEEIARSDTFPQGGRDSGTAKRAVVVASAVAATAESEKEEAPRRDNTSSAGSTPNDKELGRGKRGSGGGAGGKGATHEPELMSRSSVSSSTKEGKGGVQHFKKPDTHKERCCRIA